MTFLIGVRNLEQMKIILLDAPDGKITLFRLDLTSLESVRNFASEVSSLDKPIGVLINMAAMQGGSFELTRDGNEKQFQVNYLSHFLLTNLLIHRMIPSSSEIEPASIMNISSTVQAHGKFDLQNLNSE
jgi:NAD(P)-dependent dehydrogenase (short-subunit alcohol dehydrogenase family)